MSHWSVDTDADILTETVLDQDVIDFRSREEYCFALDTAEEFARYINLISFL